MNNSSEESKSIPISYQKLAALMVQWVATEEENCKHGDNDDNIRDNNDNRGRTMMLMIMMMMRGMMMMQEMVSERE